jgi:predicted thioesterase
MVLLEDGRAGQDAIMNVGALGEATLLVAAADTAKALSFSPEDDFPEVLATTRMIGLMEIAAARAMRPLLQPGQLSVGVGVFVRHLAATPVGVLVRAVATFQGMDGKLHRFKVQAFDRAGLVGEGEHTRAIVGADRLVQGAISRNESQSADR